MLVGFESRNLKMTTEPLEMYQGVTGTRQGKTESFNQFTADSTREHPGERRQQDSFLLLSPHRRC